jgi:hypothetical protein
LLNKKRKGEPVRMAETARYRQRRQPDGCAAQEPERRRQGPRLPAKGRKPKKAASEHYAVILSLFPCFADPLLWNFASESGLRAYSRVRSNFLQ